MHHQLALFHSAKTKTPVIPLNKASDDNVRPGVLYARVKLPDTIDEQALTPERQETDRHDWTTHEEGSSRTAPALGLTDLLMVLSRRKYLLLGTIGIVTLLGIINVFMLTPLFTATTSVMVDPQEQRVINV